MGLGRNLFLAWIPILVGCSDPVPVKPVPPEPPAWRVVLDSSKLDRAVLSIWGHGADVFAVGGPLGNGQESLGLHYNGDSWAELHPGGTETYWWVGGTSPQDVWMVGEKGRISHWDGNKFVEYTSGTTATLWGVWAAAANDAWIVGGTPEGGTSKPNDIVLHWNGASWSSITLPNDVVGRSLYKVWGTSSDDLFIVGEYGTIWHKIGADWILESKMPLAMGTLFTVSGSSCSDVYAVGNFDVLHSDGQTWEKLAPDLTGSVNGVSVNKLGEVAIVGFGGLKQRLVDGQWTDDFESEPHADLHAVWADGKGDYWAVGGNFVAPASAGASRDGVVARYGTGQIATEIK